MKPDRARRLAEATLEAGLVLGLAALPSAWRVLDAQLVQDVGAQAREVVEKYGGDIGAQGEEVFNTLAPDSHVRMQDFDFATIDIQMPAVAGNRHLAGKAAMCAVVAGQMCECGNVRQVVDSDNLQLRETARFMQGPQHTASDASVTIDRDAIGHFGIPAASV